MSSLPRIAKEILDRALSHFKKQKEDEIELLRTRETLLRRLREKRESTRNKERYEPGADFYELFSKMMGGNPETSGKVKDKRSKPDNPLEEMVYQRKEKATEQKILSEYQEGKANNSVQSSVFERFSRPIEQKRDKS